MLFTEETINARLQDADWESIGLGHESIADLRDLNDAEMDRFWCLKPTDFTAPRMLLGQELNLSHVKRHKDARPQLSGRGSERRYVYAFHWRPYGMWKLGISNDPLERCSRLSMAHRGLRFVAARVGDWHLEQSIHDTLAPFHKQIPPWSLDREWYSLPTNVVIQVLDWFTTDVRPDDAYRVPFARESHAHA